MKTDHRVLLWCVAAWMCCIAVNCRVEFFDADGNALREEDILDKDWIVKNDKAKTWDDSYRRTDFRTKLNAEGIDEETKKACQETCGFEIKDTFELEEEGIKCLHEKDPVECECVQNDGEKLGFDYKNQECRKCGCGENADGCFFDKDEVKNCTCKKGFAQKGEICVECGCGQKAEGCSFDKDNVKTCKCENGFAQKGETCVACGCGEKSEGCSFDTDNVKTCKCEKGFAQKGETCVACDCGEKAEGCSFDKDNVKNCTCQNHYTQIGEKCVSCFCGSLSDGCSYDKYKGRICVCKEGAAQKGETCSVCGCGENSEGCSFDRHGLKTCTCKKGFAQRGDTCVACSCGENSEECSFDKNNAQKCKCKKGFAQKGNKCADEACVKTCGVKSDVICEPRDNNIECDCQAESKKFHSRLKECRIPCEEDDNCQNGATCESVKGTKFCECLRGTSGDTCEDVKDCMTTGKYSNCTGGEKGTCTYDLGKIKAVCVCEGGRKLMDKSGYCNECDCGEHSDGCEYRNDKKQCKCKEGYADKGGKCVDEKCVEKCGNKDDNICTTKEETIECECKVEHKKFDSRKKKCRDPCMDKCAHGGKCELFEGNKFCECLDGTSGDQCENVHECKAPGKYSNCTGGIYGNCTFDAVKGKPVCLCEDEGRELMDKSRYCEECNCGKHSEDCVFVNDKKLCTCKPGYSIKNGTCVECKCGENSISCSFSGDKKICKCKVGFGDDSGTCKACSCDENSKGCSFKDGKRTCICKANFALKDDKCEECDCGGNAKKCTFEGGKKTCDCKEGFTENKGVCQECKCGINTKPCRFENDQIRCGCQDKFALKEGQCTACGCGDNSEGCTFKEGNKKECHCKVGYADNDGTCKACECGDNSKGCTFKEGNKKECHCEVGYGDNAGTCKACECGDNSKGCTFKEENKKECLCEDGYGDNNGACTVCVCGENSEDCYFKNGEKQCKCKSGYSHKNGECVECNCGEKSTSCSFSGDKKICECQNGFSDDGGTCNQCDCGESSTSCSFENGKKICQCKGDNAQNGEKCEECKCGINTKPCSFENGEKKCDCRDKFGLKEGNCTACECGDKSKGCTFKEENKKECHCEDGYGDKDGKCTVDQCMKKCGVPPDGDENVECKGTRYGNGSDINCTCFSDNLKFDFTRTKCRETCVNDTQCKNSAKCETSGNNTFCNCLRNTDGYHCEILPECGKGKRLEKCTGDRGKCKYNVASQEADCDCPENKIYDQKEGYCQDKCTEDKSCSNNKICYKSGSNSYCTCEEGKTGDNCEIATGCNEVLRKLCEIAKAECVFSKNAVNFADCVCKDKDLVYNAAKHKCVAKFCNDIGCKSSATCDFDPDTKTAYCKCPSGKYYNYNTETCSEPDKCLLKKTPCKENEVCEKGVCTCKGNKTEDKCIIKLCKDVTCFKGAKCDEDTGTCKCEDGKYFTGSSCEDVKCIKDPFADDCPCPDKMERKESKKCVPKDDKPTCDKDCGLGSCVEDTCRCINGVSKLHEGKCVLDKNKICASRELKDSSTCLCTGKYKPAADGKTCDLVTCSDEVAKQTCKNEKATCKMTWTGSIGYSCECPAGYIKNKEKGICTDPCSVYEIAERCSSEGNLIVCYNSYSVPNKETSTCDCAPPFRKTTDKCDDVAEFAYLISDIPVMKQRYQMEYGIDYVKLNSDLMQSLSQMYPRRIFETGYLHEYVEDGDVLKTSVWVRFNQDVSEQLDRFKLQAQKFNGTCEDCDTNLYLWPPYVVLKGNEFNDVKTKNLTVCEMKDTLCGEEAMCNNNTCSCPRGYKTIDFTIMRVSDKARILRCEKSNVVDLDECALGTHTCPENTTCFKIPKTYICKCKPGYWKSTENDQKECVDMCTPSPCQKGTCSMKNDKFNCKCQAGYSGSYCDEMDVNFASAKKSTVVVGAVLGTILIVGVLAALFFYIKKRKSSYSEDFMPAPRQDIASEMRERRPIRGVVNTSYE